MAAVTQHSMFIIIIEAEGHEGSKVLEVTAEGYKPVSYRNQLCFFKVVVDEFLLVPTCSHFWFILAFVIGECVVSLFKCVAKIDVFLF